MVYSTDNEQGFDIRMIDNPRRCVADFDGIKLITYQNGEKESNNPIKDITSIPFEES